MATSSNVLFNDKVGETSLSITLTADPGFEVGLLGFDLAAFPNTGETIPGLQVRNAVSQVVLFSQGSTFVTGSTRNDFGFFPGLFAPAIVIDIDLTGLGTFSDNIAIDNVYFVQETGSPIPVPTAVVLLSSGLLALVFMRRGASV